MAFWIVTPFSVVGGY